jgi:acetyl-CoA carboxylase, biotin carboxylase subunit
VTDRRLSRVLVANRGEIAVRIIRACFDEQVESVAAVSEADRDSLAARLATDVVTIGPASASASYLSIPAVIGAALVSGADAIHPGYGFLSERPELAEACAVNGLTFVGPPADVIRRGGNKVEARQLARSVGIPVGPGSERASSAQDVEQVANTIGYPVLLKAAAGGGGRGMVRVFNADDLRASYDRASNEALQAFGDGTLYVERYVANARHVEVQVLADGQGGLVHLGERDCSCQRRYQKLVEEAPASWLPPKLREALGEAAIALAKALDYVSAGTVEFLVDVDREDFFFLEINTRVQVEHPVTEMITGVDIVREQLRVAAGKPLSISQDDVQLRGHAIECRINAEMPDAGFLPSPGLISRWTPPAGAGIRLDSHCHEGYIVPPHYDSLLGKLICYSSDRRASIELMDRALDRFHVEGVSTTIGLQRALIRHGDFRANKVNTRWVEEKFLPTWSANSHAK